MSSSSSSTRAPRRAGAKCRSRGRAVDLWTTRGVAHRVHRRASSHSNRPPKWLKVSTIYPVQSVNHLSGRTKGPDGVWDASSMRVGLHDRQRTPTSPQSCFPHPIRRLRPHSFAENGGCGHSERDELCAAIVRGPIRRGASRGRSAERRHAARHLAAAVQDPQNRDGVPASVEIVYDDIGPKKSDPNRRAQSRPRRAAERIFA
jgi:hypothetical protein